MLFARTKLWINFHLINMLLKMPDFSTLPWHEKWEFGSKKLDSLNLLPVAV